MVGDEKDRPPPKGVSRVEIEPSTQTRATIIIVGSAAIFLLALVLSLRTPGRLAAAGVSVAFLGPVMAVLIAARSFTRIFTGYAFAPFDFAGFIVLVWNENQPLLFSLYCGSAALIVLLVVVMVTKPPAESGAGILIPMLVAIAGAAVSFLAFVSLTRLVAAIVDPIAKDPIVLSYEFTSLGEAAQTMRSRLILAIVVSLITTIALIATLVLSFILRPLRARVLVVFFALIVMFAGAWLERTWCDVLKTTALTGRFPDTFLTR